MPSDDLLRKLDVARYVQDHPRGMMLAGFGLGVVLGAALRRPQFARLLRLALRVAVLPLLQRELVARASSFMSNSGNGAKFPKLSAQQG